MHSQQPLVEPRNHTALAIFVVLGLACLGLCVWFIARANLGGNPKPYKSRNITEHPVTTEMSRKSAAHGNRPAPSFACEGTDGKSHSLDLPRDRPLVLVFIKTDCPCSVTAQPFFNRLFQTHHERVEFLGVINADLMKAKGWRWSNSVPFPLLSDADESLIRSYGAEHSAYSALVTPSGQLEHLWPGFSASMLETLSERLVELTRREATEVDFADAPEEMYSGCPFSWTFAEKATGHSGNR